jgi:hypothetical protein
MFGILWSPSLRLKVRQRENLLSIFVTHVWSTDSVVRCYLGVLLFIVNGWNKSEAKGKDYHYWFAVICCVREALDSLARSFSACVAVCQSQAIGQTRAKSKHDFFKYYLLSFFIWLSYVRKQHLLLRWL